MRVALAGTPEFAACAFEAIHAAGQRIVLVLTQPDRPAGRGLAPQASPVKRFALDHGYDLYQSASLRQPEARARIRAANPDVMVVAAYGLILPAAVLAIPRLGCINIHASLLPRWRGAAPIQRALLAGDARSGITLMQMDEGLDTGPMLVRAPLEIGARETGGSLHDRLAALGAREIVAALARLEHGPLPAVAQPAEGASYAAKIAPGETWLDWRRSATELDRAVRAFDPLPGARARLGGTLLKIRAAQPEPGGDGEPGRVLHRGADGILVACGSGALRITQVQRAGGRRLPVADFLAGFEIAEGERFELAG